MALSDRLKALLQLSDPENIYSANQHALQNLVFKLRTLFQSSIRLTRMH